MVASDHQRLDAQRGHRHQTVRLHAQVQRGRQDSLGVRPSHRHYRYENQVDSFAERRRIRVIQRTDAGELP